MIEDNVGQLIEFLKNASPAIWQVLIKQVYIEASEKLFWGILFGVVAFILFKIANSDRVFDDPENNVFLYAGSGLCLFIALVFLVSSVMWFINPDFYAIRFILQSLSGS
jgi:hypothetical protein